MNEIIPENFKDYNSYRKASGLPNQIASAMWMDERIKSWNKLSKPNNINSDAKFEPTSPVNTPKAM